LRRKYCFLPIVLSPPVGRWEALMGRPPLKSAILISSIIPWARRWAQHARQTRVPAVLLENFPEADAAEAGAAARVDEKSCRRLALDERGPALLQVSRQPRRRLIANGHQPLLTALAGARQVPAFEIQILLPQAHFGTRSPVA
jgi:hypothetical protein